MDANGDGEIGFEEFTLLDEERWRIIDPFEKYKLGLDNHNKKLSNPDSRQESRTSSNVDLMSLSDP